MVRLIPTMTVAGEEFLADRLSGRGKEGLPMSRALDGRVPEPADYGFLGPGGPPDTEWPRHEGASVASMEVRLARA